MQCLMSLLCLKAKFNPSLQAYKGLFNNLKKYCELNFRCKRRISIPIDESNKDTFEASKKVKDNCL